MKKRRTLIIALLLVAALCLGIGYAGYTGSLDWIATYENDTVDLKVHFINVEEDAISAAQDDDVVAHILQLSDGGTTGGTTINPSIDGLAVVGDSVTFDYTVRNDSDIMVELDAPTHTFDTSNQYFSLEVGSWDETILDVGDEAHITVKMTLTEYSADIQKGSFTITAVVNPYTADN